ncbi:hypothetical protein BC332_19009 [Capsicum chinense]|uniref:RNase III domain-containing protein n=1 Tax=Capsicum annuum TaxID=4072 RepID=A0A2G2Z2U8_CAPAN|nr:hypothetical protein T459_19859 [Capsicum annuum]PHU12079.1 hypothetical protein BC332_19009 [Capsicum chinense]
MEEEKLQQRERLVEEITGYKFKNPDLLHQAFTHTSFQQNSSPSNDRLEYLGDSVLNQLIAKEHYFAYPNLSSGNLTDLKSVNVDTEKLARVAIKYNLHDYLRYQIHLFKEQVDEFRDATMEYPLHSAGRIDPPKVLADIVESLIGAIYIDSNFSMDTTWKVVKDLLQPLITPATFEIHPVKKFNELCQKNGMSFKVVHDNWEKTGEVEYFVDGKFVGKGKFSGKKEIAQNRAAYNAYDQVIRNLRMETTVGDHL